jgi:hypothetical protein
MREMKVACGAGPVVALLLTGCLKDSGTEVPAAQFVITATLQELMDSTVDPAADALWNAVEVIATAEGIEEKHPHTDEQWQSVRRGAITLIEATNLLVMQGRRAAPPGTQSARGELTPAQIDRKIAASRPTFEQFANVLRLSAVQALNAIDRRDSEALLDAGNALDEACEACHLNYWYPRSATASP